MSPAPYSRPLLAVPESKTNGTDPPKYHFIDEALTGEEGAMDFAEGMAVFTLNNDGKTEYQEKDLPELITIDVYTNGNVSGETHVGTFIKELGSWEKTELIQSATGDRICANAGCKPDCLIYAEANFTKAMNLADGSQNILFPDKGYWSSVGPSPNLKLPKYNISKGMEYSGALPFAVLFKLGVTAIGLLN